MDKTDLADIFYIIESNKQIDDLLEPISDKADDITSLCNETEKIIKSLQTQIEHTIRFVQVNDLPERFQTSFLESLESIGKSLKKIDKKVSGNKDSIVEKADQIYECRFGIERFI